MTDYLKPVKASYYKDKLGIPRVSLTPITTEGDVTPVIISDSRWLTRAEFEACYKSMDCHVVYTENKQPKVTIARHLHGKYYMAFGGHTLIADFVTHVLPIPAPEPPSEPTK